MMKRYLIVIIVALAAVLAGARDVDARKANVFRSPGGASIGQTGLMLDASYDKRLDSFVPGYKVVNVAIMNGSFDIIYFDPEKDKWSIGFDGDRKRYVALHDLRRQDPKAWSEIPEKARGIVAYPLVIPIGGREVIDLFVPEKVDVENFTELDVFLRSMNVKFEILVRQ